MSYTLEVPISRSSYVPIPGINTDPTAFWRAMEEAGATIGSPEYNHPSKTRWEYIVPDGQYVPPDEGVHFMLAPRDHGAFIRPEHMSASDLVPAAASMLTFTDRPNRFTGYNIAPDRTKQTSQSWHNLHVHHVELPQQERLAPLDREISKLREVRWTHKNRALAEVFTKIHIPGVISVRPPHEYPKGGVEFVLDPTINPETLAAGLKVFDTRYRALHRRLSSLFVRNYDAVIKSGGKEAFQCSPADERAEAIDKHFASGAEPFTEQYVRQMNRFITISEARSAQGKVDDPQRARGIVRVPAYTIVHTIDPDTSEKVLKIGAHMFRNRGATETIGVVLNRQHVDVDFEDGRRERAAAQIAHLNTTLRDCQR